MTVIQTIDNEYFKAECEREETEEIKTFPLYPYLLQG